ncbi:hypothetical protein K7640_10595 [Micromonospora sp. PLK6-60]|uniref:hypothetical protein n=1 Tax=Micromonospora sp. PLK6-60 TaxID=2873383 RepID=UPI001CA64ABD|nr:hypothetical protein [Micromonospora sp. PLK6-60]MBY8872287.1 hypothetical protein [Micromonospora sp. PLK6-60]
MTTIDNALWDAWFDDDRIEPGIVVRLAGVGPEVALVPRIRELVEQTLAEATEHAEALPLVAEVVVTPDGICLAVVDGEDARPLLEPLAVRLTSAGVGGVFVPYPVGAPSFELDSDLLECRVVLPATHTPADLPSWRASPGALRDAVRAALSWLAVDDWARATVTVGTVPWATAGPDLVADLLPVALAASSREGAGIVVREHGRFRAVAFLPDEGHLAFAVGPLAATRPPGEVDVARALAALEACAPWSRYGFVRRSRGLVGLGAELKLGHEQPDLLTDPTGASQREIEEHRPLDAFGAQLIARAWRSLVPGERWLDRPTGPADLIVARDLSQWWAAPRPGPQALARGRADLAGLLGRGGPVG